MIGNICKCFTVRQLIKASPTRFAAHNGKILSSIVGLRVQIPSREINLEQDEPEIAEFGTLAEKRGISVFKLPPELRLPKEKDEDEPVKPRFFSAKPPIWYFNKCQKLAKQTKWEECLSFFEEKMLKKDKVFPEEFNYSVVIGALGRAGQAEKAFRLYRGMRERGLQPSAACYTGLFNSVAESQNGMNLKRAISLYSKLHRNKIRMSRITYNSLMKAFGRHGTTEQMMGIFRESLVAGFEPDVETFNTIILCMKRDRDAGFRKAIEVWRQMIMLDIKPNGKSVVHLLQVLKNCGIGDADEAYRKLIKELPEPGEYKDYFRKYIRNVYWLKGQKSTSKNEALRQIPLEPEILTIEPGSVYEADFDKINNEDDTKTKIGEAAGTDGISDISKCGSELPQHQEVKVVANVDDITMSNQLTNSPNLLDLPFTKEKGHETAIFQIKKELRATDRLELIGGYQHIFDVMEKYEIQPTKMVLSALAWVLPSNRVAENDVIEYSTKHRVQLDTDFFNSILRKRVARQDFSGMHEILEKMVSIGLTPNYRTWCIMALSCQKGVQGVTLINEIKSKEVELNEIFFKSLISAALRRKTEPIKGYQDVKGYDYRYLGRILREMKELGIKADQQMIVMLETASDWPEGYERWKLADTNFEQKLFKFRRKYNQWLDATGVAEEIQL